MNRPKVGLALGSGGARGFAHLGVIKVLVEHDVPIDYIAGSSMGSLVGAIYGSGHKVETMEKMASLFKRKYYLDFTVPKMGFITGNKVKNLIRTLTHGKQLEDLQPPLAVVTTDLIKGEKVVYRTGSIAEAVRASIAIPGIFTPEKIGDRLLVDGGVIDRVPVSVAREMGADLVIAVDVSDVKKESDVTSIFDVIMQSIDIMQNEMVRLHEINADVMIKPRLESFHSRSFTNIQDIIKTGEEEAFRHLDEIHAAVKEWKEKNK
ncbi:patatin-like phospholipase family protein [Guptibacillus algicola]|uniref:patatin-like phospholipase family protein n=1 Tax=Guptibacillus algicola TaxID=225844 RepID=UPI001CD79711|nr:patatin-like phospholipase family protein [Alkalihalobacillus algicola]MCA0987959.1 patatin-like phospholipase family protein [Alkalihalobacillus algicola]